MSEKVDVLVLGAGLAGLSAAYHLRRLSPGLSVLVAEKERKVGGRAGTERKGAFLFDHTGHLLHLHDPYGKAFITGLLKGNLALHERSSWIHSCGVDTRYPFQANTYGLPRAAVAECLAGFARNLYRPRRLGKAPSFMEWSLAAFGEGISRRFMFPYNEKLWRTPLDRLTTEWQGRFLPRPRAEEVLYGALADENRLFGYNAYFRYPKRGGCQALPDALAARVPGVRLGCAVREVDLAERTAVLEGLGEVRYEKLVTTLPLKEFLDLAGPLPAPVREARRALRWVDVHNLNVGVGRAHVSGKHWVYFPEKEYPFYRVGFMSNFASDLAPRGTSSLYIEVSRRPEERVDRAALERACLEGLRRSGLLKGSDRVLERLWLHIRCGYVIYDRARTPAVARIQRHLRARDVWSIGRWGGWKYSFMEETILDGKRAAEEILGRRVADDPRAQEPLRALK
ncbi:MAG: FAD-dependent oxidoreductase [Elusimicrobia bacterium]|nr:FAD-dependent oxidoreductase [Elusimicrobiota bacterium]